MSTALNIALVALAFFTAVAAIGGDTWKKGKRPVWRSITRRGWIAIVCLVLTFGLGVWKELLAREEAEALRSQRDRMAGQISQLTRQLEQARKELRVAVENSVVVREFVCNNRQRFKTLLRSQPEAELICGPGEQSNTR